MTDWSTAASYFPRLLAQRLSVGGTSPLSEREERLEAAALFVDISGFTALTERVAQGGPAGAEVLQRLLNQFFGQLIDLVTDHGGDVAAFAGDALIAFWQAAGPLELASAADRSFRCALAMREAVARPAETAKIALRLRIGIGAGPLWTAVVGGVDGRWHFLMAGAAISAAAAAVGCAGPDEILVAANAASLVAARPRGDADADGFVRLGQATNLGVLGEAPAAHHMPVLKEESLAFSPKGLFPWTDDEPIANPAEFRLVTVLFLRIDGFDDSAYGALARLQGAFTTVQEIVRRYEGTLTQLVADDKGLIVVAAWGLRTSAHEDNSARALAAAQRVRTGLAHHELSGGMGIATGRAFCCDQGNARRRAFTMIGEVVNLASRLSQAADDGILCDTRSMESAASRISFEALLPISIKGTTHAVRVFRPLGAAVAPSDTERPLVGRQGEQRLLAARLDQLEECGRGGLVIIEGDAGMGKSRLLRHVRQQAAARGFRIGHGTADIAAQASPYFVWRRVLEGLMNVEACAAGELRTLVLAGLDEGLKRWAPLLNSVLPLDLPDSPETRQITGQGRASLLRDLICRLLESCTARTPTVITFDDAQWFDSGTWDVIAAARRVASPLLLVVGRRVFPRAVVPDGEDSEDLVHIVLERLDDADLGTLLLAQMGASRLDPSVAGFIGARSQGNPFFAEELARALLDWGALVVEDDRAAFWSDVDLEDLGLQLPDSVHGIVAARIDWLGPQEQLTIKVASVIGTSFSRRILGEIYPDEATRETLDERLDELRRRGLIALDPEQATPSFVFKHVITRDVAYDQLSFDDRRRFNRAVARWYEREFAGNLSPHVSLLAHHWKEAASPHLARSAHDVSEPTEEQRADGVQAIGYLETAAEQALAVYANAGAIKLLETAVEIDALLSLEPSVSRKGRWEFWLGQANLQRSQNHLSEEHLRRSMAIVGRPVPRRVWPKIATILGQSFAQIMRAATWTRAAPVNISPSVVATCGHAADVYHELSEIAYFDDDVLQLLFATAQTLKFADKAGTDRLVARACSTAAVATGTVGLHRAARYYCRRSIRAAGRTEDLAARAFSQLACGVYLSGVGAWLDLDSLLADSARIFAAIGDRYRHELTLAQRAYMYLHQGQFARSRELLEEAAASAEALRVRLLTASGLLLVDLAQNRIVPAAIRALRQLLRHNPPRSESILGFGVLAVASLHLDDRTAAAEAAAAVAPFAKALPPAFYSLRGVAAICEAQMALIAGNGARDTRWTRAETATMDIVRFSSFFPIGTPAAHYWRGHYASLCGHHRHARQEWERATAEAEKFGMPYDAGLAYLARGRQTDARADLRRQHLERAAGIFRTLQAEHDLTRTERALREV